MMAPAPETPSQPAFAFKALTTQLPVGLLVSDMAKKIEAKLGENVEEVQATT
jgi:hypothetical protein